MILEKFPKVQRLSPPEKLPFVSELWNDLESPAEVSGEVMAELDRGMEHFQQHADESTTWDAVTQRIHGSRS